jgi:conjugal transfer pilus assembly protein TraE
MQHTNYLHRLAESAGVRTLFIAMLMVSIAVNLMLGWAIATMPKGQRTVFIPSEVRKSFWVDTEGVSSEYMEQMGLHVVYLQNNVTPQSVRYQGRMLLGLVDPAIHPTLKKRIEQTAVRLERDGVSTMFTPGQVIVDATHYPDRIAFVGQMTTLLTEKRVAEVQQTWMVQFATLAGNTVIKDFRQTSDKDPLGLQNKPEDEVEVVKP